MNFTKHFIFSVLLIVCQQALGMEFLGSINEHSPSYYADERGFSNLANMPEGEFFELSIGGSKLRFRKFAGGAINMGVESTYRPIYYGFGDDEPFRPNVNVAGPFFMQSTLVTNGMLNDMLKAFGLGFRNPSVNHNPYQPEHRNKPVDSLAYTNKSGRLSVEYIVEALNVWSGIRKYGYEIGAPTEEEWQLVACLQSEYLLGHYRAPNQKTVDVGGFMSFLGLEMWGNLYTWVASKFNTYSRMQVVRGGSWRSNTRIPFDPTYRKALDPAEPSDYVGLRLLIRPYRVESN